MAFQARSLEGMYEVNVSPGVYNVWLCIIIHLQSQLKANILKIITKAYQ